MNLFKHSLKLLGPGSSLSLISIFCVYLIIAVFDIIGITAIYTIIVDGTGKDTPLVMPLAYITANFDKGSTLFNVILGTAFVVRTIIIISGNYFVLFILAKAKNKVQKNLIISLFKQKNISSIKQEKVIYALGPGVTQFVFGFLLNFLKIGTESILLLATMFFVLQGKLQAQLYSLLAIGLLIIFFIYFAKSFIYKLGYSNRRSSENLIEKITAFLHSRDSLISLKASERIMKSLQKSIFVNSRSFILFQTFTQIPRYLIEILIIIFIIVAYAQDAGATLMHNKDLSFILLALVLRIMPSLGAINSALSSASYNIQGTRSLVELSMIINGKQEGTSIERNLVLQNSSVEDKSHDQNLPLLSTIYRVGKTKVDLSISTRIPQSGIVFLEGESGIGKSTFLKFLAGIADFEDTKQLIPDKKWSQLINNKRISNSVYLNNSFYHEHGPIGEVVLGGEALTVERHEALNGYLQVSELYSSLNITSVHEYLDLPLSKVAASYSTGELSRIIASCLVCRNESIIYVDELFDHIGVETRANILAWFEKTYPKKLMVIISHNTFGNYKRLYLRHA